MTSKEILAHAVKLGTECEVKTWMELKKLLLLSLPSGSRSLFSVRHPKTKKQSLNEFERWLCDNYQYKTGATLTGIPS